MARLLSQTELPFRLFVPFSEPETSREAAGALVPVVARLEAIALEAIRAAGERGLTDAELESVTGLGPNTARPRRVGLVLKGLVVDSGIRRNTSSGRQAKVWVVPSQGGCP